MTEPETETVFRSTQWSNVPRDKRRLLLPADCEYKKTPSCLWFIEAFNKKYYMGARLAIGDCPVGTGFFYVNKRRRIGILFGVSFVYGTVLPSEEAVYKGLFGAYVFTLPVADNLKFWVW